jgi:hypothetical protein
VKEVFGQAPLIQLAAAVKDEAELEVDGSVNYTIYLLQTSRPK